MNTDDRTSAQAPLLEPPPPPEIPLGRGLQLVDHDGRRAVFLGATPIHLYDREDRAAEAAAIASLARAGVARRVELAKAFGCHRNTVWRLEERFDEGGMAGVVPAKRGPKGPHKVTPAVLAVLREHCSEGAGQVRRIIAERTGVQLSRRYVRHLLQDVRAAGAQPGQLLEEHGPAPEAKPAAVPPPQQEPPALEQSEAEAAVEPPPRLPERGRGRYMGAALFYPALEALGLLEAAAACFRLAAAERFGVRAMVLTLFFLTVLSKPTVEAAKHLRRWEFGPLIGAGRAPAVKTLRRKLAELVTQSQAIPFGALLARRWVEQGVIATAYLSIDGHMKAYTGKRKLAEVWSPLRRMPVPGLLRYFVNDQRGRPLLFVTEEANATLAQSMKKIVAAIRDVVQDRPFTVIFDRGGYDGKLFAWLHEEEIDFITYQKGKPGLPKERFRRRRCRFNGQRQWLQLAEDEVKVGRSGPWRRIVARTSDGHQTPILTSLTRPAPAKIACLILARWGQENFFKYSKEHHGLDQLVGNAWAEADGERLVPNPERKGVERQLKAKRQELARREREQGQVLLDEPGGSGRSADGIKIAQGGVVGQLRAVEQEITTLEERRAALPKHLPQAEAGERHVLRLEQKAIIDRVKMTAYNAEEWLLELLVRHYPNLHDARALLRSFAELGGELRTTTTEVVITLDAPDLPRHRRALSGLCADLNQVGVAYPGTDLPVRYQVAVHHSETPK